MKKILNNILSTIGNTPIVELKKTVPEGGHHFFAKIEYFNPGGSIKDRVAHYIVKDGEETGKLKKGGTIIEATSGNTGVGLAIVGAIKGYKTVFIMPDKVSEEKRAILRAYGAKVIICPTAVEPEDPRSYYSVARKMVELTPNSFYANQYHNPANPLTHYETTGPEIWEQMDKNVDVVVIGTGTGGTISGIGKFLKEKNPKIKIVAADPIGSILYDLFYYKEVKEPPKTYKVEGVGEDFLPSNVHFEYIDDFVRVDDKSSFLKCRELAAKEGLCVGPSSALALMAAIKYSAQLKNPSRVLVIFPDGGRGYLSKAFNEDWLRDNEFVVSPLLQHSIKDLIDHRKKITPLVFAEVSESVLDVVRKLKSNGISQVPVYSDNKLVGLLDEGDLLIPLTEGRLKPLDPIIHLIRGTILEVNLEDSLMKLSQVFQEGYVALVKDSTGHHQIITKIDLLEYMGQLN